MELPMSTNTPYLIYILHKDEIFLRILKNMILTNVRNISIKTFSRKDDIFNEGDLTSVDLIITDISFIDNELNDLNDLKHGLFHLCNKIDTPYLFILDDDKDIQLDKLSFLNENKIIYDFILKSYINEVMANRIKVLLSIPKIAKTKNSEILLTQANIWNLLNYSSNTFVVVLDSQMNVKIANYHLYSTLGFEKEDEILGKRWTIFIKESMIEVIEHVHEEVLKKNPGYSEFAHEIVDKAGKLVMVKWFNSMINSDYNWVFSIGIPLIKEPTIDEDIDSIRSYFKEVLERDKTTILAMKEVALKHSKRILGYDK